MNITVKLLVVLLVAAVAVILLNALGNLNAGSFLTTPEGTPGSAVSASPTLRAPFQEGASNNPQDLHLTALLSFIGLIGILLVVVNYMKWTRK
jgi:hypothetical protein